MIHCYPVYTQSCGKTYFQESKALTNPKSAFRLLISAESEIKTSWKCSVKRVFSFSEIYKLKAIETAKPKKAYNQVI